MQTDATSSLLPKRAVTWTWIRVASARAVWPLTVLAAFLGLGIVTLAGIGTAATGLGTSLTPFGPVAVHHGAIVCQAAPTRPIAGCREAQRVDTAEVAGRKRLEGAPACGHRTSQGVVCEPT